MLSPTQPTHSRNESSPLSLSERQALIVVLSARFESLLAAGFSHRAAVRATATESGLTAMAVKRFVELFPEA